MNSTVQTTWLNTAMNKHVKILEGNNADFLIEYTVAAYRISAQTVTA